MKNKIKILIADDQPLFLKWLDFILNSSDEFEVMAKAADGTSALQLLMYNKPDIALLDYDMPGMNGLYVAKEAFKQYPKQKIIIITVHRNLEIISEAKKIGVAGFLLKDCTDDEIIKALKTVHENNQYYTQETVSKL